MMRRWLVVAGLLVVAGCGGTKAEEPIWIGHLTVLSGPDAARGEAAVRAMELRLAQEKDEGRTVNGRTVGVRHVDVASKGQARAEATRLLTVNRVAALIVGPGVGEVDEVAALARGQDAAVVVLDEVADEPGAGGLVRVGASPAERGRALAAQGMDLKRQRALVYRGRVDAAGQALAEAFTTKWREGGGAVVEFAEGERGLKDLAEAAKRGDAVVLLAVGGQRLVEALEALPEVPVLLGCGPGEEWLWQGRVPPRLAVYEATAWTPLAGAAEDWRRRYEAKYHLAPSGDAALATDALSLVLTGLHQAARGKLRQELLALPAFAALTGELTWADGRPRRPVYVVRWQGGTGTLVRAVGAGGK